VAVADRGVRSPRAVGIGPWDESLLDAGVFIARVCAPLGERPPAAIETSKTKEKHMGPLINKAAKAILAAVIAGLGSLATVMVGDAEFADLTTGQWVTITLAVIVAFGGVYGVRNSPAT
jgi:hypothetical protein